MFDLGEDINDLNTNKDKLQLSIADETNNKILNSVIKFNSTIKLWKITLMDGLLTKGAYNITVNGLLVPGAHTNSDVKVEFIRKSDDTIVLYNNQTTTASFPALAEIVTQNISLIESRYLLEGSKMELIF